MPKRTAHSCTTGLVRFLQVGDDDIEKLWDAERVLDSIVHRVFAVEGGRSKEGFSEGRSRGVVAASVIGPVRRAQSDDQDRA